MSSEAAQAYISMEYINLLPISLGSIPWQYPYTITSIFFDNYYSPYLMDNTEERTLPSYEHEEAPSYVEAPSYNASTEEGNLHAFSIGTTLTLDPTGMFIKELASSDAPPVYSLSKSLLHVNGRSSIHVKRPESKGGETSSLAVYAIGEHFISPLHTRKRELQNVTAARSHGLLVSLHLREIVWDFSTQVPLKKGEGMDEVNIAAFPVDPVYMIGNANGPGTVRKSLLQFYRGKWVDDDDKVVALEREGGAECKGMPVLSVTKDLDQEMMDFLVSAWCVTMWGEVGKRAHHLSKSGGSK